VEQDVEILESIIAEPPFSQVLDCVLYIMNNGLRGEKTVFKVSYSSITYTDRCNTLAYLSKPDSNEAVFMDAYQELHVRMGCPFTRFSVPPLTLLSARMLTLWPLGFWEPR
jgi:hypothetical protein